MRRTIPLLALTSLLAGCGFFHKTLGLKSGDTPAHTEPRSTSIFGDWVLATPADSTAFAGANQVELHLDQSAFTITASYPSRSPIMVHGSVTTSDQGLLVLTPQSGAESLGSRGALVMAPNQPISLVASAAGNTLVFAPPHDQSTQPSSVWHKRAAAKAAGTLTPPGTKPDGSR
jgi:hypothetical protein